jgi:hypothetical protein
MSLALNWTFIGTVLACAGLTGLIVTYCALALHQDERPLDAPLPRDPDES